MNNNQDFLNKEFEQFLNEKINGLKNDGFEFEVQKIIYKNESIFKKIGDDYLNNMNNNQENKWIWTIF